MAKIQIKSYKVTPFGAIFSTIEKISQELKPFINKTFGQRCSSNGYKYGEIIRSLITVYFCVRGAYVEDVTRLETPTL